MQIRTARLSDRHAIAELMTALDYPGTEAFLTQRMQQLLAHPDEALLVADRVILLGGAPGRLMGEWRPQIPHPRDNALEALAALRLDILKKLRDVRADTDAEKRYVPDV